MPNGRRQAAGGWRLATGDDANREQTSVEPLLPVLCSRFLFPVPGSRFPVPGSVYPVPSIPDSLFPIPYSVLAAVPGHEAGANRRGAPRSTFHRPERSHAR